MAGINQGRPETAIGEPIRFGDDLDFEIEQHPISDRLIIRDTANGKEAYVRADRGGTIGGDGVLIKALKEGKPVADDGRTHDTIQQAERAASSFVFVPPGTFNENVTINTEGLTIKGTGHGSFINSSSGVTLTVSSGTENVVFDSLRLSSASGEDAMAIESDKSVVNGCILDGDGSQNRGIVISADSIVKSCTITGYDGGVIITSAPRSIVVNNNLGDCGDGFFNGIDIRNNSGSDDCVVANNLVRNCPSNSGISVGGSDSIIIGNRVLNSGKDGIRLSAGVVVSNTIIANNRVSDSAGLNIDDGGTGTLLDGNLTGPSN